MRVFGEAAHRADPKTGNSRPAGRAVAACFILTPG
jgi:hypothetical protein